MKKQYESKRSFVSSSIIVRGLAHHFYRATLCVSTDFAVARCLSVGLSRWCIHTAEDIVKLLV